MRALRVNCGWLGGNKGLLDQPRCLQHRPPFSRSYLEFDHDRVAIDRQSSNKRPSIRSPLIDVGQFGIEGPQADRKFGEHSRLAGTILCPY
jgi:hypothetical protein